MFGYIGIEGKFHTLLLQHSLNSKTVSLSGWIVTFMTKIRNAASLKAGASSTGFWAGMTIGRVGLSFLTSRLGEFRSVIIYLGISIAFQLLFWLVPNFIVSAVAVAFLGMFIGPMFPTAMVLMTKLLPRDLHVGGIGFATAFGGSGGALFPFIIGAIAQNTGVKNIQPVILAMLVGIVLLWLCLPRTEAWKKDHPGNGQTARDEGITIT